MPTLIVGAGMCGLTIAGQLPNSVIWEKSKGVGGRLATRRTDTHRFDHGAQYYSLHPEMSSVHQQWTSKNLSRNWFAEKWCGTSGMTSLAKDLAAPLDIRLETRLSRLVKSEDNLWLAETADGKQERFKRVILTCPLPQSLEIADSSKINYPPSLRQVVYAKALVGLFEIKSQTIFSANHSGYLEPKNNDGIFSISDQQRKQVSAHAAWTVVMNPEFSERYFDHPDETALKEIENALKKIEPKFTAATRQLKKWRYSHPTQTTPNKFALVHKQPELIFAGDSFGGASISGAVRSALSVIEHLNGASTK